MSPRPVVTRCQVTLTTSTHVGDNLCQCQVNLIKMCQPWIMSTSLYSVISEVTLLLSGKVTPPPKQDFVDKQQAFQMASSTNMDFGGQQKIVPVASFPRMTFGNQQQSAGRPVSPYWEPIYQRGKMVVQLLTKQLCCCTKNWLKV